MADDARLLLLAHEAEEVPTISGLVQGAAVRVADIAYDRRARRVVLLLSRYRWEAKGSRVRAALRIGSVESVARRGWPGGEAVLELLALTCVAEVLTLAFADGASLRVTVECPDLTLEDLSEPWAAREPRHD